MKIVRSMSGLSAIRDPLFVAAGYFDGVHKGHRAVIKTAIDNATAAGGRAWALTFDRHPLSVLAPDRCPLLLTSTEHKLHLLETMGLHGCMVLRFTRKLANMDPSGFLSRFTRSTPDIRQILAGKNWSFGKDAAGNWRLLKKLAQDLDFRAVIVKPVDYYGLPISSTRIRDAVGAGRIRHAARMLGRPFGILGTVVHGNKIGRRLGAPTANIDPHNEVVPPPGVYFASAMIEGREHPGIANMGFRPTLNNDRRYTVEIHILDKAQCLYGRDIEVVFLKKHRDETRFAGLTQLKGQIRRDIRTARKWFTEGRPGAVFGG